MSDPVFGISYDPEIVHFETAPSKISSLCSESRGQKFWLYAYSRAGETEYFVLSNQESKVSGVGVVISGGKCVEGLPDWILTGNPEYSPQARSNQFPPEVVHGLAVDLLRRYATAFGGKNNFLEAMRKDGLPPDDETPVLKEEFQKFSK